MQIGDTVTVSYEESKKLRKEGWKPRNDVVVMMYVGESQSVLTNRRRSNRLAWTIADHDLADRKMAEESKPVVIRRKHRRRRRAEAVQ